MSLSPRIVSAKTWLPRIAAIAFLGCGLTIAAQDTPLFSVGAGFFSDTSGGLTTLQPAIAPVLVAPLGKYLLVESRGDFREIYAQNGASNEYHSHFFASMAFAQLDIIASRHITIVGGKFLVPFGTYNERLTPFWIPNFQGGPLIYGIGTKPGGAANGGMARGDLYSNRDVQLSYVVCFSGASNIHDLQSARTFGDRISFFFPRQRLEIGTSYQRYLEQTHLNSEGVHLWWLPYRLPVEVRSDYAHTQTSHGYWLETAFPLFAGRGGHRLLAGLQPAFRMQQTFRIAPNIAGEPDGLPAVNTQEADFGLDYVAHGDMRLNTSYSRSFSANGNKNIWDASLTYRFLFPMWRGSK